MDAVEIGRVLKPQGIRGEMKVAPYCDDAGCFLDFECVYTKDEAGSFKEHAVMSARIQNAAAYVMFAGITDRNAAEKFRNETLYIDRKDRKKLAEDSYFIADLVGMDVCDETGRTLGRLTDVLITGAADVYTVRTKKGTMMFPALKKVILSVDIDTKMMVLDTAALKEVAVYDD